MNQRAAPTSLPVWFDAAASGPVNMAADEWLAAESLRHGGPVIRVARWSEPTLSLGAFQVRRAVPEALGDLAIVRRPSGGGAIVHGTDVTVAIAVPRGHPWGDSVQRLYDEVHGALVLVLRASSITARLHAEGVPDQRPPPAAAAHESRGLPEPYLCFDRRAPGDVVVDTPAGQAKLLGSAQRRLQAAVVQHGTLLWTANPAVAPSSRHAGVADVARDAGVSLACDLTVDAWLSGIGAAAGLAIVVQQGCTWDRAGPIIGELAARFRDPTWTDRR